MSNLERRYRVLLKVLPRWYREDREEEMAGIFLAGRADDLELEHGWPGWGETRAVLGLAVRTHLAAGAGLTGVPSRVMWRGEIVRALGMIGLLVGVFQAGASVRSAFYATGNPELSRPAPEMLVINVLPIAAFVALLAGKRTLAKSMAFLAAVPGLLLFGPQPGSWLLWQLPMLVTFACLCLGFHREAPTPPAGRLAWWGGGALLLGLVAGPWLGTVALVGVLVAVRVVALVRGDFVLGRALSVFAVLELGPIVVLLVGGEVFAAALVLVVLLVVSAVAPVRKPSFS
ncbi:hypothetical protein SK803_09830 [Lentzea sp. BCCO 10_0856]|uniref:Uncharacterized protein n=1 Tax=Lentzea miocenica TaxID=3095431 RepID=A0ABU4SX78_9PSEU|nr:hypothetical protein [Lentzea sp. BCCO 10_0856]MDX8030511.1 hypothetical protein [Lentzea sp. BCCO 10_0856]